MKNHFFIVGAQRSGTTYLYDILDQHPEICMAKPTRPEPKYFMNKTEGEINKDDYVKKYFLHKNNCKVYGEKSTSYYEKEESARLIAKTFPEAKIIFFLRNPIDRALSNYFFSSNNGYEKRSLEEVFLDVQDTLAEKPEDVSVNPFDYLGRGEYCQFIEVYKKYFSSEQIKVIIFEEFVNNIKEVQSLYEFLNVDETFCPTDITKVVNSSDKNIDVSDEIVESIRNYFNKANEKLKTQLNRDLIPWQ